jgi:hypothetical protein
MNKFVGIGLGIVAAGSLAGNALMFQRYSSAKPVVSMGSDAVSMKDFRDRLEIVSGKQVLTKMVLRSIVMSEAKAKGVAPTKADVDGRIELMKRANVNGIAAAMNDQTQKYIVEEDVETDIALENVITNGVPVTETALLEFFRKNQKVFVLPDQAKTTIVLAQNQVDATTASRLMQQKSPKIDAATIARTPRLAVLGLTASVDWNKISPDFRKALIAKVNATPAGGVFQMNVPAKGKDKSGMLVVRLESKGAAGVPPLAQIRPHVERQFKLQQAAIQGRTKQVVLAELYKAKHPTIEVSKYSPWFTELENASANLQKGVKTANK